EDSEQENNRDNGESQDQQQVFSAASAGNVRKIEVDTGSTRYASGKRSTVQDSPRGRVVRVVPEQNPSSLAVGATLRSAALRGSDDFQVTRSDLHQQVRAGKTANLILFVVDASGSMAAQRRMEAVKGAVLSLLT